MCNFHKLWSSGVPHYLYQLILTSNHSYNTRQSDLLETSYSRTDAFKNSFFPCVIREWNKLDLNIQKKKGSYFDFRKSLLKLGRPSSSPVYNIHNLIALSLLTCLRVGLSHFLHKDSNMTFKIVLIHFVVVIWKQSQSCISFYIAFIILIFV